MQTIYLAEMETKHYTFRVASASREVCHEALKRGVRWHCEQAGILPGPMLEMVARQDYSLRIMETGVLYRDSWPIGPCGSNSFAPGKDPKVVEHQPKGRKKSK